MKKKNIKLFCTLEYNNVILFLLLIKIVGYTLNLTDEIHYSWEGKENHVAVLWL